MREASHSTTILHAAGVISTSGDNVILAAPGTTFQHVVEDFMLQNKTGVAMTALVKFGSVSIPVDLPAYGDGLVYVPRRAWELGANNPLVVNLSSANGVNYHFSHWLNSL